MIVKRLICSSVLAAVFLHCAPSPTEKIDIGKARTGFLLSDGSTISQPETDDYSPVLVRSPDDTLILVFASDRSCSGCSAGQHHLFIARSVEPFYGGFELPAFNNPVVLQQSSVPHVISPRSAIFATWMAGALQLFVRFNDGNIKAVAVGSGNLATGTTFTPELLTNSARATDQLLYLDLKNYQVVTAAGGQAYKSSAFNVDSGTPASNPVLGSATSAAPVASISSGYAEAFYTAAFGRLYSGTLDEDFGEQTEFNAALDDSNLYLTTVSVLRTPSGFFDLLVFSAGDSSGAPQDLYFVNSHDVSMLWLLGFNFGFEFATNPGPYRVFVTAATSSGNLGGVFGADEKCRVDTQNPDLNVNFKAMVVDGSQRIASLTSDTGDGQVDWVLSPLETYVRSEDGATIGTAGSNGLLTFPVSAAVATTGAQVWTGLTGTWTTGTHCFNWTEGFSGIGEKGLRTATNSSLIQDSTADICTSPYSVYCVEQPF